MSRRLPLFTTRLLAFAVLALSLGFARTPVASAASGITEFEAHCSDSGIVVHFTYVEDPLQPTGHPEWTQFALHIGGTFSTLPECPDGGGIGTLAYIPRTGSTQSFTYLHHPEPWNVTDYFDFFVEPVTAQYQSIYGLFGGYDRSGCPIETAPAVMGTIRDLGWAVITENCPTYSCGGFVLVKEPWASQLRPYAGTGQALLLYGEVNCDGPVEGGASCNLTLHHFDLIDCPTRPVPVRKSSWGQLKVMHR